MIVKRTTNLPKRWKPVHIKPSGAQAPAFNARRERRRGGSCQLLANICEHVPTFRRCHLYTASNQCHLNCCDIDRPVGICWWINLMPQCKLTELAHAFESVIVDEDRHLLAPLTSKDAVPCLRISTRNCSERQIHTRIKMVVGGSDYDLSRVLKHGRSSFWTCDDMVGIKLHMSRSTALLLPRHGWSSTSSGCSRVFFHTSPGLTRRRTLTSLLWEIPWSHWTRPRQFVHYYSR